jgi:hypothetical protein
MKYTITHTFTFICLLLAVITHAQAPQGIPYQAAARNSSGAILASTNISVRFTIRDSIATGAIKYRETHSVTTTAQGMFSLNVGQGTVVSGTFASINWATNAKFMQMEMDPAGGSSYIDMGTSQMMSVPYALYAANSGGSSAGWADSAGSIYNTNTTQRVGIGTATPAARLHVADSSVVFTGGEELFHWSSMEELAIPPISGTGSRMMWYADKSAFRTGWARADEWDKDNVGIYSLACGYNAKASGAGSIALGGIEGGFGVSSTGFGSISMGFGSASGDYSVNIGGGSAFAEHSTHIGAAGYTEGYMSTAIGSYAWCGGEKSTAIGGYAQAGGPYSLALGGGNLSSIGVGIAMADGIGSVAINGWAEGDDAYAIGDFARASGDYAYAIGNLARASGDYSTAIGHWANTQYKTGSFAIFDYSVGYSGDLGNDADNQMMMHFAGGYKFYSDTFSTVGVSLAAGGNSWATISDIRKKENFAAIDGEAFLRKIAKFKLTSWNYKGQDPAMYRHYGPMAQDFYAAFGKDQYGTVGNDTTINQADMEGVSFIAIQALVKRTEELQKKVNELECKNNTLSNENTELKAELTGRIEAIESEIKKSKIGMK